MNKKTVLKVLAWSILINYAVLLLWFLMIVLVHDWIYLLHSKWFSISEAKFDLIHYFGLLCYKMFIVFFNLIPYLALRFVR